MCSQPRSHGPGGAQRHVTTAQLDLWLVEAPHSLRLQQQHSLARGPWLRAAGEPTVVSPAVAQHATAWHADSGRRRPAIGPRGIGGLTWQFESQPLAGSKQPNCPIRLAVALNDVIVWIVCWKVGWYVECLNLWIFNLNAWMLWWVLWSECKGEWVNIVANVWMLGWISECFGKCVNGTVNVWTARWFHEYKDECVNVKMNVRM